MSVQSSSEGFSSSIKVSDKVVKDYSKNSYFTIKVLKNSDGSIGAYVLQPAINGNPIPYLDCNGEALTSFHIFASDDEKKESQAIIDKLRKEFPIEEPLDISL